MYFRDAFRGYCFQESLFSNLEERPIFYENATKKETFFETLVSKALLAA
jgi:hypothetical protein